MKNWEYLEYLKQNWSSRIVESNTNESSNKRDSVLIRKINIKQKVEELIKMLKIDQVTSIYHTLHFRPIPELDTRGSCFAVSIFIKRIGCILTCAKVREAKTKTVNF